MAPAHVDADRAGPPDRDPPVRQGGVQGLLDVAGHRDRDRCPRAGLL